MFSGFHRIKLQIFGEYKKKSIILFSFRKGKQLRADHNDVCWILFTQFFLFTLCCNSEISLFSLPRMFSECWIIQKHFKTLSYWNSACIAWTRTRSSIQSVRWSFFQTDTMLLSLLYVFFLRISKRVLPSLQRLFERNGNAGDERMREIKNHFNPPQQGICIAKFSTSSHSNTPHCMEWCLKCEVLIRINYYYLFFRCLASSLTLSLSHSKVGWGFLMCNQKVLMIFEWATQRKKNHHNASQ